MHQIGVIAMDLDYKNLISHLDIDRNLDAVEYLSFKGLEDEKLADFRNDIEEKNDTIELHLIKSMAYKDALILGIKSNPEYPDLWSEFLKEEQKTFGGSKIFYLDGKCSKMLILSVQGEMQNKLKMVIGRANKINEKIKRINAKIRKDNIDLYSLRLKGKESENRKKEEFVNLLNLNLRV